MAPKSGKTELIFNIRIPQVPIPSYIRNLKINAERLNNTLHETSKWGEAHRWGE